MTFSYEHSDGSVKSELNTKMDDNKKQILGAIRDMKDEMREDIKAIGDKSIRNEADIKSLKERKD